MANYEDEEFNFTDHLRHLAREAEENPYAEPDQDRRRDEIRILCAMYRIPSRSYADRNAKWAS